MACRVGLTLLLLWLGAVLAAPELPRAAGAAGGSPLPASDGCQRTCGGVDIPFPFGIGPNHCQLSNQFHIDCNDTGNGVFKPSLPNSTIEILNISLSSGQMRVFNEISSYCYNASSGEMEASWWDWDLTDTMFAFSDIANVFTVMGCRTSAYIGDNNNDSVATYKTGCVSMCRLDDLSALENDTCSGMGCCQTSIPAGLQEYVVWFDNRLNASSSSSGPPCSYAVLTEDSSFTFLTSYVTSLELQGTRMPVVLDWVVEFDNCTAASTKSTYACISSNSTCIDVEGAEGYICNCTQGFEGNPYLIDGCEDINECEDHDNYPCFGKCTNTFGSFRCSCPAGTRGNATIKGQCQKNPFPRGAQIAIGISGGFLVVVVSLLATQVFIHKRSTRIQGYFEHHGGQMLARILKTEGIDFTFFKRGDITKATRSFHNANIVGEGAHGAVYKGIISVDDSTTTVAVKRCKQIDQNRTAEFVQELVILCRLNHPNIVKLLGCCLHFEAPMLVYEFMPNGTLNDLLHGQPRRRVTLATRLRIIAETSEALTDLHSPPRPTLHGDVKPENILLGEGWVAKVSDFGCSTINDNVQVMPKGTLAYLDPEFLKIPQITEKTDVYSFGVVLMEVLTGKKPLTREQKNLTIIFQEAMSNGTLNELLDIDIVDEGDTRVIHRAAELARRCTSIPGNTRPTMGQVAEELRQLSNEMPEHPDALHALERATPGYIIAVDESQTMGSYNIGSIVPLSTELAR